MMRYSVLIPARDARDSIVGLLRQLKPIFDGLLLPYEWIVIDDASGHPPESWEALVQRFDALRVLRFDAPRGTSAALAAGIAAARGKILVVVEPGGAVAPTWVPHLIARLSQHHLVTAHAERALADAWRDKLVRVPEAIAGEAWPWKSEPLLWAALREALASVSLARGACRILPEMLALRGLRVCRLTIGARLPPQGRPVRPNRIERLAAAWFDRRFEPHRARELTHDPLRCLEPIRWGGTRLSPVQPPTMSTVAEAERER